MDACDPPIVSLCLHANPSPSHKLLSLLDDVETLELLELESKLLELDDVLPIDSELIEVDELLDSDEVDELEFPIDSDELELVKELELLELDVISSELLVLELLL